jgi:hypothetical protein
MLPHRRRLSRVAEGTGPKKPQQPGAIAKVLTPARNRASEPPMRRAWEIRGEIRSQLIPPTADRLTIPLPN